MLRWLLKLLTVKSFLPRINVYFSFKIILELNMLCNMSWDVALASLKIRFCARVIDFLLAALPGALVAIAFACWPGHQVMWFYYLTIANFFWIIIYYYGCTVRMKGTSLGKFLLKIRVACLSGKRQMWMGLCWREMLIVIWPFLFNALFGWCFYFYPWKYQQVLFSIVNLFLLGWYLFLGWYLYCDPYHQLWSDRHYQVLIVRVQRKTVATSKPKQLPSVMTPGLINSETWTK